MRGKRFSEEQTIGILKEAEAGVALRQLMRKHEICEGTYYRWKAKYRGLELSDAKLLRQLEQENLRLKWLLANVLLDK
jgi:putative transposase